jgi:dephospho-CoA kinase
MILGVTGTDGGGKGTLVEYLVAQKGFIHCSARALWVDEMQKRGLEISRANMRLTANSLRAEHGNDYLVQEYLRRATSAGWENVAIDSIRATAEADTLRTHGGILLAVDADPKLRYERMQSRAAEKLVSFEEFMAQEALEMNDHDPSGMQKAKVMQMADYTLTNNGTLEELHHQIDDVLAKLGRG